jgi:hypothetical protein
MNQPTLRVTRPGQLPASRTSDDSLLVLNQAIDDLARQRTAYWLGDSAVHLHALASLIAQAEQLLPQAVHHALDQELTWAQIGELLNATATTAAPLPEQDMINLTRITGIMQMSARRVHGETTHVLG